MRKVIWFESCFDFPLSKYSSRKQPHLPAQFFFRHRQSHSKQAFGGTKSDFPARMAAFCVRSPARVRRRTFGSGRSAAQERSLRDPRSRDYGALGANMRAHPSPWAQGSAA